MMRVPILPHNIELEIKYNDLRKLLTDSGLAVSPYDFIDYGLQFSISLKEASGMIRIFQNKKGVLRTDLSQVRNEFLKGVLSNLLIDTKYHYRNDFDQQNPAKPWVPVIGTDESGKGDYFGPLVSAGVFVDEINRRSLLSAGVRDSKKLSDKQNLELAELIISISRGKYAIIEISPERYNALYDQFRREKKNLNTLLAWGHAKALEEILTKVDCHNAIADKFADEKFIISKLQERGRTITLIQKHKAEENIAVAAASIIARARFLNKLSKLSIEYGMEFPKGSSSKVIETATRFVHKYGINSLVKVAKLHFKTTSKILI